MDPSATKHPRIALVTGANRGIGRAIATQLVAEGFTVAGLCRSESATMPDGVHPFVGDVSDSASITAAVKKINDELGPISVLVANAGITRDQLAMRMSEEDFSQVLDVNLTGAFRCVHATLPAMIRHKFGRIIFLSSVVATLGGAGQINYAASKAGLIGMARSLTREVSKRGITANVIAPGFIDTDMTAALPEKLREAYLKQIPAGRFGQTEEIARAVAFLASDHASYISGAVLPVDGGLGMGH